MDHPRLHPRGIAFLMVIVVLVALLLVDIRERGWFGAIAEKVVITVMIVVMMGRVVRGRP